MSESFLNCPQCTQLLMSDAALCPTCGHVLDEERAAEQTVNLNDTVFQHGHKICCRNCEVDNGFGLVRCWNCGSFLREDIEKLFREQVQNRSSIDYYPLPEVAGEHPADDPPVPKRAAATSAGENVAFETANSVALAEVLDKAPRQTTADAETHADANTAGDFDLAPEYAEDFFAQTPEPEDPALYADDALPNSEDVPASDQSGTTQDTGSESETYSLSGRSDSSDSSEKAAVPDGAAGTNGAVGKSEDGSPDDSAGQSANGDGAGPRPSLEKNAATSETSGTAHSEATGGDVLLQIALDEEKERVRQQKKAGQKKRVKKKVPPRKVLGSVSSNAAPTGVAGGTARKKAATKKKTAARKSAAPPATFTPWLNDIRLHEFDVAKVKLKPGSVENQFRDTDVGFSAEKLVITQLTAAAKLFSRGGDKKGETRTAVRKYWEAKTPGGTYPGADHFVLTKAQAAEIKVVQPCPYEHESPIKGVAIFGSGRIAVSLGPAAEGKPQRFLSFSLMAFRQFSEAMSKRFDIKDLGQVEGVPLTDNTQKLKCHYSDEPLIALEPEGLPFYEADPALKLKTLGYRCQSCKLVVSEEARRKEKIGGLNGKAIARAKCPKCGGKFGQQPLQHIDAGTPAAKPEPVKA